MQLDSPTILPLHSGSAEICLRPGRLVASRHADRSDAKNVFGDVTTARRGWVAGLWWDAAPLLLSAPLVVMVPPVMPCRHIETNVGFYAGESLQASTRDGIVKRWALFDSRIEMLIRPSGR